MNIRTLIILAVGIAILLYFINKKVYRIESACYDDEDLSSVLVSKGILGNSKLSLKAGESKNGYSLIKNTKGEFVLTFPNKKTRVFKKYSFYEQSQTSPIG